ncbi:MAG: hypothetical protein ACHQIH_02975, partial [Ignavibacteria bacterium]
MLLSLIFIAIAYVSSRIFDIKWGSNSSLPMINLNNVYKRPVSYDNLSKVNLVLFKKDMILVESNKKFVLRGSKKSSDYFDTLQIYYPEETFDRVNKIFLRFDGSASEDSIHIVISKSTEKNKFYHQIFYSTVSIQQLNQLSSDVEGFRLKPWELVSNELLINNDSLINNVFTYFNENINYLGLAECGTNCEIFKKLCQNFSVPCRLIGLQGGDEEETGFFNKVGYPMHVVCEIYSSKLQKWYVVDPSFGFRFSNKNDSNYLNAVELSNDYTFMVDDDIRQDSILLTKRSTVGRDYFKYYENVMFSYGNKDRIIDRIINFFYQRYNNHIYHYSSNYPLMKNGLYYLG